MSKKGRLFYLGMAVIIAGWAGFFVWQRYQGYQAYRAYNELEAKYVRAMTEDTYGGKTPQETLDLFVTALKAEDVELAAKYFVLDDNLSREKWVKALQEFKEKRLLDDMTNDIEKAIPNPEDSVDENDFKYILLSSNGLVSVTVNFRFNTYSKVWKIESL